MPGAGRAPEKIHLQVEHERHNVGSIADNDIEDKEEKEMLFIEVLA